MTIRHRVVVWPWLRRLGSLVVPDWLAITVGHRIFAWRAMTAPELEHELAHVRQWARHGSWFPLAYLRAAMHARRTGGSWYRDNRFEVEAREAAARPGGRPSA